MPKEKTTASRMRIQLVMKREYMTETTPTSTVSVSASARPSPTGMKSQAAWQFSANRPTSAREGEILPAAISAPMMLPRIWEMTAPGPRIADRPGIEHTMPRTSSPGMEPSRGCRDAGEEGTEARAVDDTDQHGNECHEGEQCGDGSLDCVARCLVEGGDDLTCAEADLGQGVAVAGLSHLLGELLGGVDAALFLLSRCFCCRCSVSDGGLRAVCGHDVGICYAGDIDVFLDELGQGTCLADGVDVDGGDALLGIEAAAEGAAAVDDDERELIFGGAGLEAVDGLEAGQLDDPGQDLGGTPPPVMYITLFFFSVPWMVRGPPKPPEPFSTRIARKSDI